jgi:hypothetical protein
MLQSQAGAARTAWPKEEMLGVHTRKKLNPMDYVCDFTLAAKESLSDSPLGFQFFELNFLQVRTRADVKAALSLTEEGFEHLLKVVKSTVGQTLRRKRLVPGRKFQEALKAADEEDRYLERSRNRKVKSGR